MESLKNIYILHGWTYTLENWQPIVDNLRARDYKVTLLKVPGLTTELEKPWNLNDYVDWLNQELKGKNQVYLIGHSNGGRIAIAFTAKYPQKVEKLILIDSAGITVKTFRANMKKKIFKFIAKTGKKVSSSPIARKWLYKIAREKDYEKANPIMRETMSNLITVDIEPLLTKITVPTLIIWGELDKSTPLKDGKLMSCQIKDSKFEIIKESGHSPHVTHRAELVKLLVNELK